MGFEKNILICSCMCGSIGISKPCIIWEWLDLNEKYLFTFSSHTEYVKRESIVIAWVKKKFSPFDECSCFVCLRRQNKQKKCPSACPSVCLSVRPSVWMSGCTWTYVVDTITFEGVSGSKQNLVGVFYVWNVGLVLKSKVKSWSWSWSWS